VHVNTASAIVQTFLWCCGIPLLPFSCKIAISGVV